MQYLNMNDLADAMIFRENGRQPTVNVYAHLRALGLLLCLEVNIPYYHGQML
jgi:hypothetical protein